MRILYLVVLAFIETFTHFLHEPVRRLLMKYSQINNNEVRSVWQRVVLLHLMLCFIIIFSSCAILYPPKIPETTQKFYIPEPIPPPTTVRTTFNLDPFYQQWIDIEGLPVVASAKVNSYALQEAAWLIRQMIGHRKDILRALAKNNVRFVVMAHNEMTTQIPEHSDLKPDFFWDVRARGLGSTPSRPAVSCGEENLLNFHGDPYGRENILIHEFSHAIHQMGLNTIDSTFDKRLAATFNAAVKKGLWQNTYAITNREEYWAEGAQSWFNTNRANDYQHNHVDTREKLKVYDPTLAALLTEVYGDSDWRYSRVINRLHLLHLKGYFPSESPKFSWPSELVGWSQLQEQMLDPASDGNGKWVILNPLDPTQHPKSTSAKNNTEATVIFANSTKEVVSYYWIDANGTEHFYGNVTPSFFAVQHTFTGHVWVVKDPKGNTLATFRAAEKTGRAFVSPKFQTK